MPTMLDRNSFDTACHEHLEYFALRQIQWMAERVGFRIVDLEFNDVNGGSFSITCAKTGSGRTPTPLAAQTLEQERQAGLDTLEPYRAFAGRVAHFRDDMRTFVQDAGLTARLWQRWAHPRRATCCSSTAA